MCSARAARAHAARSHAVNTRQLAQENAEARRLARELLREVNDSELALIHAIARRGVAHAHSTLADVRREIKRRREAAQPTQPKRLLQ